MHNIQMNLKDDPAGLERVLQCIRFRRFEVHKLEYGVTPDNQYDLFVSVVGKASFVNLVRQLEKLSGVEVLQLSSLE